MPRSFLFITLLLVATLAAASDCKQPFDEEALRHVGLGMAVDVQLKPGQEHQFQLATLTTYAPAQPVPVCATWKIAPENKGATISSEGLLKIDPTTAPGSKFVVTADIENGRTQRTMPIMVYTDESNPLVGYWNQTSVHCTENNTSPAPATGDIKELEFRASGWFSVTWTPFETYRDYWGSYTVDPKSKQLSFKIDRGNYIPKDFQGSGTYKLTGKDTIEFHHLYFGTRMSSSVPPAKALAGCVYVFTRSGQSQ
jgi:hypothetical protein